MDIVAKRKQIVAELRQRFIMSGFKVEIEERGKNAYADTWLSVLVDGHSLRLGIGLENSRVVMVYGRAESIFHRRNSQRLFPMKKRVVEHERTGFDYNKIIVDMAKYIRACETVRQHTQEEKKKSDQSEAIFKSLRAKFPHMDQYVFPNRQNGTVNISFSNLDRESAERILSAVTPVLKGNVP